MKISKLFHWLYATLMFLPFIFLLPTLAYYGFNEHATNTETTTINYKYKSNEVNSVDDLVVGNIYHLNELEIDTGWFGNEDDSVNFNIIFYEDFTTNIYPYIDLDEIHFETYDSKNNNCITVSVQYEQFYLYFTNSNTYVSLYLDNGYITFSNVILYLTEYTTGALNTFYNFTTIEYTDYNVIESVEVNTDNTITGQVSRSWDSVWNLPLFSWTHTSFVSEPFTYITGLFGMSADNPFNYVVTYFVSISVCWLVFDFLMYVPNLAHRWLDKGALE